MLMCVQVDKSGRKVITLYTNDPLGFCIAASVYTNFLYYCVFHEQFAGKNTRCGDDSRIFE